MGRIDPQHKGKRLSQQGYLSHRGQAVRFGLVQINHQSQGRRISKGRVQQTNASRLDQTLQTCRAAGDHIIACGMKFGLIICDQQGTHRHKLQRKT